MKIFSKIYMWLIFAVLYAPVLVLVVYSFNRAGDFNNYSQFSLYWYIQLFRDAQAFESLKNSLFLAVTSSLLATLIGTFAALGIDRMRKRYMRNILNSVTNIPMMNPDIVTGVSMMLLFVGVASWIGLGAPLGRLTMIIAHTTFNIPYVILSVQPRFRQMDKNLTEAALDLGCTPTQTFFRVELPFILPGIVSGLMMGFTLSLDDFVISHFVSSPDFKTLPLYIYNQTAHEVKYSMYALCTLMIVAILAMLLIINFAGSLGEKNKKFTARKDLKN